MIKIVQLPAWDDNFIYIIHSDTEALIIDPTESDSVFDYLNENKLEPLAILNTHHHPDHIGGNPNILKKYHIPVYCSEYDKDRVPGANKLLKQGDSINILGLKIECIDLSGHTLGLIGYYIPQESALFSGDCIFSLGCGYLFEGSYQQMLDSLNKVRSLPPETNIYCSHEYTLSNANFQRENEYKSSFSKVYESIKEKRARGLATVPSTVQFEKDWNLFLRWDDEDLKKHLGQSNLNDLEFLKYLRELKNNY